MLSWYVKQVGEHGWLPATRWLVSVVWARSIVAASNALLQARFQCPCCGWEGRKFLDYIEVGYRVSNAACPKCDSHSRHRAFYLWLRNEFDLVNKKGVALVFAPEKALAPLWESAKDLRVCKVDIEPSRGVDLLADLMRLPFAADSIDLIWCHHVLEQIEDDHIAIAELRRVLQPLTGEMVLSVGMSGLSATREFGFADEALSGNRRAYGADFVTRLEEAGLKVKTMEYNLSEQERRHFGVFPERFFYCSRLDC